MRIPSPRLAAAAALLASLATAQIQLVAPAGYASTEGGSNNAFPWNRGTSSMRYQQIYDSSHFTRQGASFPVLITRLRFRADAASTTWTGGIWPGVRIDMSTAAVDYAAFSMTFANNHGPDRRTVHDGQVAVQAGRGNGPGAPGPWYVEIPVSPPFPYDPASGSDLVLDVMLNGLGWSGTSAQADAVSSVGTPPPLLSRLWNPDSHNAATATRSAADYGLVTEFTYAPATGYAFTAPYGVGCPPPSRVAVYELFPSNAFDLSNTGLLFQPGSRDSYVIGGGPNIWFTGYANNLGLGNDSVAQITCPFSFPHPGGSTSALGVSSNGFVWLGSNGGHGCCSGTLSQFLQGPPRIAACWGDLDPSSGGGVYADLDPATGEYVITWVQVPEYGRSGSVNMQIALRQSGAFELRFGACRTLNPLVLTGYSMGLVPVDPGPSDLSAALSSPIRTASFLVPATLAAGGRPALGASFTLDTGAIPSGSLLGGNILGLIAYEPGLPLASFGALGCWQHVRQDLAIPFAISGPSASTTLAVPNAPALAGVTLFGQSVTLSPGLNPRGMAFTNGLRIVLGAN